MLELEVVPEHGLQGEAIEFLLGEMIGEKPKIGPNYWSINIIQTSILKSCLAKMANSLEPGVLSSADGYSVRMWVIALHPKIHLATSSSLNLGLIRPKCI